MDFLNRAYAQLFDLYRSMTPGSRMTAGLLSAVVMLSLGYLFTHQAVSPDVDLMHGKPIAAAQLPAMVAAFAKANLKNYEVRGTSIFVPRGQEAAYMTALADGKALPPDFGSALHDAVSTTNFFEDRPQREQRNKLALQDTLAFAIGLMPGIERAYVLYDVAARPGFNKEKLITASACVKPAGAGQLAESQVSAVRKLVAGAIAGLKPENVTVSDLNGRTWYANPDDAGGADDNLYITLQRTYEQDLKAKILNALCFIPSVTVELSVMLDRERVTRIKQDRRSPAADRRGHDETAKSHAKDGRTNRGATSFQPPNTAAILNSLLGCPRADDDGAEAERADAGSREQVEKESVGLTPILARVSVGVPIGYFKKVWQERNGGDGGRGGKAPHQAALDQLLQEESVKIQKHVAQLLPSPESVAKAAELVRVTTFEDVPTQLPPLAPLPDFNQTLLSWLRESWATLGMIAVALLSLLVLRSMVRPRPLAESVHSISVAAEVGDTIDVADEVHVGTSRSAESRVPPPHTRRFHSPNAPMREELSQLVETDPNAAINVLRNWIGPVG